MWTRESLRDLVRGELKNVRLICVSNREPYIHNNTPEGVRCMEPASGVVTAIDPIMQAAGGTLIAHGSGTADRETADARGRLRVPPGREQYTLRRVWLTPEEEEGYYYGFSNETLWPLCHIVHRRPRFDAAHWRQYERVNAMFADAVVEEAGDDRVIVFIQDYHFALLPALVKQRLPRATVLQFWHIPWPNPEAFRICPWKSQILEGLLGNDLLAFHIQYHCNNFMETVDRELESRIDREHFRVVYRGSPTLVRPHPISVDFEATSREAAAPQTRERAREFARRYGLEGQRLVLGVDRLDYTKGIMERLRAIDCLLERHPEYRGRFRFVELGAPTRTLIPAYDQFQSELEALVEEVNRKHRAVGWEPVLFLKNHHDRASILAFYTLADACVVTSLHDGMNLVAKEFVAARSDNRGALVLSCFTGAAREFGTAMLVNPYAIDGMAEVLHAALQLPESEQAARMERMREIVREQNVYKWVGKLLLQAARIEVTP